MKLLFLISLFQVVALVDLAYGNQPEVPYGTVSRSPNGVFSAKFRGQIRITNTANAKVYEAIPVIPPIYSIKWTGDSKTIVTIEHIAGGTQTALLHFDGAKWQRVEIDPPGHDYNSYTVTDQYVRWDNVDVTYKARTRRNGRQRTYKVQFTVAPTTGKKSRVHITEIFE